MDTYKLHKLFKNTIPVRLCNLQEKQGTLEKLDFVENITFILGYQGHGRHQLCTLFTQ